MVYVDSLDHQLGALSIRAALLAAAGDLGHRGDDRWAVYSTGSERGQRQDHRAVVGLPPVDGVAPRLLEHPLVEFLTT